MFKQLFVCSLLAACVAGEADAASIIWGAGENNGFSTSSGPELPVGSLVRLGYFNVADSVIIANQTNVSFLNSHFVEAASARIGDGILGTPASNFQATSNGIATDTLGISGKQMFLWAFQSSDNSSLTSSINTALEIGIFYLGDASWLFPEDVLGTQVTIDLTELTDNANTALVTGANVLVGSFPKGASTVGGAPNFALAVVPEPATAGLAMMGGAALLLRRRRH